MWGCYFLPILNIAHFANKQGSRICLIQCCLSRTRLRQSCTGIFEWLHILDVVDPMLDWATVWTFDNFDVKCHLQCHMRDRILPQEPALSYIDTYSLNSTVYRLWFRGYVWVSCRVLGCSEQYSWDGTVSGFAKSPSDHQVVLPQCYGFDQLTSSAMQADLWVLLS